MDSLITYIHQWPIIKTRYSVLCRRAYPTNEVDIIVCGIVNNAGGVISINDLGLLLGFGMVDLNINDDIKFFKDEAEIAILELMLKPLLDFHLLIKENSHLVLTFWGTYAINNHLKYRFYNGEVSLYSFLHFHVDPIPPFQFHTLGLLPNVTIKKEIAAFELSDNTNELVPLANTYLKSSPLDNAYTIDSLYIDSFSKEELFLPISITVASDQSTIYTSYKEVILDTISSSLDHPNNLERKRVLIEKANYFLLLSSNKLLTAEQLWKYRDYINWYEVISDNKIDWSDNGIFDVFTNIKISTGSIWADICFYCPVEILIYNISKIELLLNWTTLTEQASFIQIAEYVHLDWDVEVILEKFDEEQLISFLIQKLHDKKPSELIEIIQPEQWTQITDIISEKSIEKVLNFFPLNLKLVTHKYVELTKSRITNNGYNNDWDWEYISSNYDLDFLAINFSILEEFLNPERIFLRIAQEENRLLKFLANPKTTALKEALKKGHFNITFQNVILNTLTIPILDSFGFLFWGTEEFSGVEFNENIIWTQDLLKNYSSKIVSEKAFDHISTSFDDINVIINNPSFNWNYLLVFQKLNNNEILENINFLFSKLDLEQTKVICHALSLRLNVLEALKVIEVSEKLHDYLLFHDIINNSAPSIVETTIQSLYPIVLSLGNKDVLIRAYTEKCTFGFICLNLDIVWDWEYITSSKLEKVEAEQVYFRLASYLDWQYIIQNYYSNEELNDISKLSELAVYINETKTEDQKSCWSLITKRINRQNIWNFIEKTFDIEFFKWDWTVVSGSKEFMFSKFLDIDFLIDVEDLLDWNAFTSNPLFQSWLKKEVSETNNQWFNRVDNYLKIFLHSWNWQILSSITYLTWYQPVIMKYLNKWDWTSLSKSSKYFTTLDTTSNRVYFLYDKIDRFINKIDFNSLSTRSDVYLKEDFLKRYAHFDLNYKFLSSYTQIELSTETFVSSTEEGAIEYTYDKYGGRIANKGWDYKLLSRRNDLNFNSHFLTSLSNKDWDWSYFSTRAFVNNSLLLETSDHSWDYTILSKNENLIFDRNLIKLFLLKSRTFEIDWFSISASSNFHINREILSLFSEEIIKRLDWTSISKSANLHQEDLDINFLSKYATNWSWKLLFDNKKIVLDETILDNFFFYLDKETTSKYINLLLLYQEKFNHFKYQLNWKIICKREDFPTNLHDPFIYNFKDFIDWKVLTNNNTIRFSKELIQNFYNHWHWYDFLNNASLKEDYDLYNWVCEEFDRNPVLTLIFNLKEQHSNWSGNIYHYSHLSNVIKIIDEGKIKSRNTAKQINNSAGSVWLSSKDPWKFARFYFRPLTPNQFYNEGFGKEPTDSKSYLQWISMDKPKCLIPIIFEISIYELLKINIDKIWASNKNMQKASKSFNKLSHILPLIDFNFLFNDMYNNIRAKDAAQQELLIEDEFQINNINPSNIHIYCKSEFVANFIKTKLSTSRTNDSEYKLHYLYNNVIVTNHCFKNVNKEVEFYEDNNDLIIAENFIGDGSFKLFTYEKGESLSTHYQFTNGSYRNDFFSFNGSIRIKNYKERTFLLFYYDNHSKQDWLVYSPNPELINIEFLSECSPNFTLKAENLRHRLDASKLIYNNIRGNKD